MAKKKTVEAEVLIKLLDEYRLDNPNVKVTIPQFGVYIRNKGYNVQDYTIRRSTEFRVYLKKINNSTAEDIRSDLVTYKTLDVDDFIKKNHTEGNLRNALVNRDRYYARVAANAVEAINARKAMERKVSELEGHVAELESQLANVQAKADNAEIRKKDAVISTLKRILDGYIYPEAANAILEKEGILEVVNSTIPEELNSDGSPSLLTCPYCSEKRPLPGYNTIKVKHPDLINEEWSTVENILLGLDPDNILENSTEKAWWKCPICKHHYLMSIKDRLMKAKRKHNPCVFCSGRRIPSPRIIL